MRELKKNKPFGALVKCFTFYDLYSRYFKRRSHCLLLNQCIFNCLGLVKSLGEGVPKQSGGGWLISFLYHVQRGGGGSINFQISLGVSHPILIRRHVHIFYS